MGRRNQLEKPSHPLNWVENLVRNTAQAECTRASTKVVWMMRQSLSSAATFAKAAKPNVMMIAQTTLMEKQIRVATATNGRIGGRNKSSISVATFATTTTIMEQSKLPRRNQLEKPSHPLNWVENLVRNTAQAECTRASTKVVGMMRQSLSSAATFAKAAKANVR